MNFEHSSFFIDNYKDHTIDDKYDLFYSYYGIYSDYVATNHLNIKLNERYQLMPDVKEYIDGMIFVLERFISINYPDKHFSFKISPTLNADTKHSSKTFNDNFEYYINENQSIKDRRCYPPIGPNNEVYQAKLELRHSPIDRFRFRLPIVWSPLSKEITVKEKPSVYNTKPIDTYRLDVKLIKIYDGEIDERIQRLLNKYIDECDTNGQQSAIIVFKYDEDKDEFCVYTSTDEPYDTGYDLEWFQSSTKFQKAINFSKRDYLSIKAHKGQIHPYCYENVKKYLAQYGIELLTAEPKPDRYWYPLRYATFYFGSKLRVKSCRYLKKFFDKHGTIDYVNVSEVFEEAEIEKFGYDLESTLMNEGFELIDNNPEWQTFWFKVGANEFEATYDDWINHDIHNLDLVKKVVETLKNEYCTIISEYIDETTPFKYIYNNKEYEVTWKKWRDRVRPHKSNRLMHNDVKQMLADEGCELISTYKNLKSVIKYIYKGKTYSVRFDHWRDRHQRPHLK